MSSEEDFAAELRSQTLAAFGLKPWDIGAAPVPWHVRIWRKVTFAYRRGKAIDWRSYDRAEAEYRARAEEFEAELPVRMGEAAERLNGLGLLPEGMRFEWAADGEDGP